MTTDEIVQKSLQYVALLLALCVHEFAHAASARALGDRTAEDEGRLTLSPLAHADPLGTVLFPLLGIFGGFPLFGWAKPVPVQPRNFARGWYAKGQVWVAAAGPISNVLQALGWLLVLAVLGRGFREFAMTQDGLGWIVFNFAYFSVLINLILAAFNIIPIPPLDGGHVASWALPRDIAHRYDAAVAPPMGFVFLIVLLLTARWVFMPVILAGNWLVSTAMGL